MDAHRNPLYAEVTTLREQVEQLKRHIKRLEREIVGEHVIWPSEWRLNPSERRMLQAFYNAPKGFLSHPQQFAAIGHRGLTRHNDGNLCSVYICRIRKKMPDLVIETYRGQGHRLLPESREWLQDYAVTIQSQA